MIERGMPSASEVMVLTAMLLLLTAVTLVVVSAVREEWEDYSLFGKVAAIVAAIGASLIVAAIVLKAFGL